VNALTRFSLAHPWPVLLVEALITVLLVAGIPQTRTEVGYRIFLGDHHSAIVDLDRMIRTFGGGLPVYIAWECRGASPCESVFDDASLNMVVDIAKELEFHPLVSRIESPASSPIIVSTGDDIEVRQLVEDGVIATDRDKLARLAMDDPLWRGTLISPDGKVGAMVVQLASTESRVTAEIVPAIRKALEPHEAMGFTFYLVGDPIDFVVAGGQLQADTPLIVGTMLVFLVIAAWFLLRSLLSVLLALGTAGIAVGWAMGAMSWLDWPEMEITQALRPGILAIALCTAIHVVTRYSEFSNSRGNSSPDQRHRWIDKVTRDVGAACLLTALTTAAGFLSFISSGMTSFSRFGIIAAIGVCAGLLLSFTALPIILTKFDPRHLRSDRVQSAWNTVLGRVGVIAEQRPRAVFIASGLMMLVSVYGWSELRVDVNERELFGENAEVVRWALFVEENLRRSDSLEIHLVAPEGRSFLEPQGIKILEEVSEYLSSLDGLGETRSVLDLLRTANRASHNGDPDYFRPADSHAANAQLAFLLEMAPGSPMSSWISYDRNARISAEADSTSTNERALTLENVVSYLDRRLPEGWTYRLSGPLTVYLAFCDVLQRTQLWSFAFAAISVSSLLWIYFRFSGLSGRSALNWTFVGMFPTVVPVVVTIGAMGLLDIPLDPGTAMVGAIILGIAVDDSIHLITAYRKNQRLGLEPRDAILGAIRKTGQALVTSSVAISIGCFALMTSSWQSIASFGLLSGVAICGALLADLIVLPAIILTFRGQFGAPKKLTPAISDIPSFAQRTGTTLTIGALGVATLGILFGALYGESSNSPLPCSILPNGAVSPFSILDPNCPLGNRDIVHSIKIGDRTYKPGELSDLEKLDPFPSPAEYRYVRAGERMTTAIPIVPVSDSDRTMQFATASLAVLFSLIVGLSVLWLSSAQAVVPMAILSTSLGVSAAGVLVGANLMPLPLPFHFALAMTPVAMLHLAITFPRRSVVLQQVPGVLGLLYGGGAITFMALVWAAGSHPSVWKAAIFIVLVVSGLAWLQILAAGSVGRESQDSLEQHRARLSMRSSFALLVGLALASLALHSSTAHTLALALVLIPVPVGYALVKYQFFDARPYARTLGLFTLTTLLYVGMTGIALFWAIGAVGDGRGAVQLGTAFLVLLCAETLRFGIRLIARRRLPTADSRLHELELRFIASVRGHSSEQAIGQMASDALIVGLAASGISIALRSENSWRIVAASGTPPALVRELEDLTSFLASRDTPVYLGPEGGEQSIYGAILRGRQIAVAAPIRWDGQLLGTILATPPRDLLPYRNQEINFIQRICDHAAAAIHNARLTEELLHSERHETLEWLATGLMHSVGRPMTIISRSTQRIIRHGELTGNFAEFVEDVRLASQETLQGLELLRTYAATGRLGRSSPQPAQGIVERAVRVVLRLHHDAELAVRPTADLPLVFHADELHRVIASLLDNALIATGPGDPMPEIRVIVRAGALLFEIEDFGCGMSPSILEQATQAFFTTRREEGGSGIGLLDAKATIERLGGQFELESIDGEGTTATVCLPAHLTVDAGTRALDHLQ
jgi:predicted RND superfamily exporter protein/signal transduction histidine kinase